MPGQSIPGMLSFGATDNEDVLFSAQSRLNVKRYDAAFVLLNICVNWTQYIIYVCGIAFLNYTFDARRGAQSKAYVLKYLERVFAPRCYVAQKPVVRRLEDLRINTNCLTQVAFCLQIFIH